MKIRFTQGADMLYPAGEVYDFEDRIAECYLLRGVAEKVKAESASLIPHALEPAHQLDANGQPIRNADGSLRKKAGRPRKSQDAPPMHRMVTGEHAEHK